MRQPRPRPSADDLRTAREIYAKTLSAKGDARAMMTGASAMDRLLLDSAARRADAEHDVAMRKLNGLLLKQLEADYLDEEDRRAEEREQERLRLAAEEDARREAALRPVKPVKAKRNVP